MPRRAGLTPARVVDAALAIVDEAGAEALTLAQVAERTGVATPSLYKHIPGGLPELRRLVKLRVLGEFGEAMQRVAVGRSGEAALRALATAYRDYARTRPHRSPFIEIAPDDPETTAAAERVVEVFYAVMRGYGLAGSEAIHAIRCTRAAIHGFTHLEAIGGFGLPEDVDQTFAHLLELVARGVSRLAEPATPTGAADRTGPATPTGAVAPTGAQDTG